MTDLPGGLLGTTAIVTVAFQLFFFGIASFFRFDKVTDLAGGSNFLLLASLTFALGAATFAVISQQQIALTTLVIAWSIRLSGFLFYRILLMDEDHRFDGIRDKPCQFLVFWVFQMAWVWVVSLPLTFVNSIPSNRADGTLVASDIAGIILAIGGLIIETISDHTKFSFKQNPLNSGKWCAVGIWSWCRHPNYFGEVLFWWGIFVGTTSQFVGDYVYGYFTLVSPLFVMALLFGLSGLPLLESGMSRKYGSNPEFRAYLQQTSVFVPLPPAVYQSLSPVVKALFFCEWYGDGSDSSNKGDLGEASSSSSSSSSEEAGMSAGGKGDNSRAPGGVVAGAAGARAEGSEPNEASALWHKQAK